MVYPKHQRPSLQAREGFLDLEDLDKISMDMVPVCWAALYRHPAACQIARSVASLLKHQPPPIAE